MSCTHEYEYQGLVWSFGRQFSGSSAYEIEYEDCYYCKKCLEKVFKNNRTVGNSYLKRIEGSFPK